jgi:hypothetical protein
MEPQEVETDDRAFLIGGGKSLMHCDWQQLRSLPSMGVNQWSYKRGFSPDMTIQCDHPKFLPVSAFRDWRIINFIRTEYAHHLCSDGKTQPTGHPNVGFFDCQVAFVNAETFLDEDGIKWCEKPMYLRYSVRSTFLAALKMLWEFKFRTVYLVGVDFYPARKDRHFETMNHLMLRMAPHFAQRGYNVINLTPAGNPPSQLEAFERRAFEDVFPSGDSIERNSGCDTPSDRGQRTGLPGRGCGPSVHPGGHPSTERNKMCARFGDVDPDAQYRKRLYDIINGISSGELPLCGVGVQRPKHLDNGDGVQPKRPGSRRRKPRLASV